MVEDNTPKTYEVKIRVLGNEVFAIGFAATSDSNRWIAIGLVTVFSLLTVLGAYGEKLVTMYHAILN